jgi:ribosome biogenesis GTPase A
LRMMIMGIPNVGKSTLMNTLLKRRVANVGDEPAVTKSQQRHNLNDHMTLTDSPGLLWPKIENPNDGLMLAAIHAIGRNATIDEEVAAFLGDILLARYPAQLANRYKISLVDLDGIGLVEAIAKKRGCLLKSKGRLGELDIEKAAMILLTDYRGGTLGRISLETPETRAAMMRQVTDAPFDDAKQE